MDEKERRFRQHFKSQYHNNEIDDLWRQCKKIFLDDITNTIDRRKFKKIFGSRKLHSDSPRSTRVRFCAKEIMEAFGFDTEKVEYWIAYNTKSKEILLKCNNSRT